MNFDYIDNDPEFKYTLIFMIVLLGSMITAFILSN